MKKRYSRIAIVSVLLAVVAVLLTISVVSASTEPVKPNQSAIERISPTPGGMQRPQADIIIDLKDGYVGRLQIDGINIPDDELTKVVSLGQYTFRPGPSKSITQFEAGTHKATIFFWPADENEPASPQSYQWSFVVTS